jgi:hypothetical protein
MRLDDGVGSFFVPYDKLLCPPSTFLSNYIQESPPCLSSKY